MPTFKLDDREVPFEPGDTIIRAAYRAGIDIPHYCWHPGLSVAANCRMCLVELLPPPGRPALLLDILVWDPATKEYIPQKKPKLVPACQQAAAEGIVVKSQTSPHVDRARSAVQELLLLNHPVDCPICDQAGECRLQDYWLEHQGTKKRMRDEPVHKPKGVVFGPTIVYDAERCIVCTRCVRVCEELAKDPVLDVRERGNLNEIVVSPGRELNHPYTLMTEHVCPVGALTATDFRFKARVWFLRSVPSVCVGCATGCNSFTDFDPRNQKVYRYRPRENLAVNKYWMCDEGMLDYQRIHDNRVLDARLGNVPVARDKALEKAAELLKLVDPSQLALVLSAEHSNEDNFALLSLSRSMLRAEHIFLTGRPPSEGDDILRHRDKNPNTNGVLGLLKPSVPRSFGEFARAVQDGRVSAALMLGSQLEDPAHAAVLRQLKTLIVLSTHQGPLVSHAQVTLPVSSWAESDATFTNAQGLVQESERAIRPQGDSRPAWRVIGELWRALGQPEPFKKLSELRALMNPSPAPAAVPRASLGAVG